jgi:hypothetical protein
MLAIRMPIIYMAITILRGVSVAIVLLTRIARPFRSRLEHNRGGGNHRLFEGGELGVGHVAEPFRYSIGRKVQVQGLRWAAVAAVQQRGSTLEMAASSASLTRPATVVGRVCVNFLGLLYVHVYKLHA